VINLTYTQSSVKINTILNWYGVPKTSQKSLDFSPRTFSKSSLLAHIFDANKTEKPIDRREVLRTFGSLESLAMSDSCWAILQSEPESLSPQHIVDLLIYLENRIEVKNIKNKNEMASKERTFLGRGEIHLKNGDTVSVTIRKFKSRFPYSRKGYSALIDESVSATPFSSIEELNEQVKAAYNKRLKEILEACEADIDQHIEYIKKFHQLKKTPLSKTYEDSFVNRIGNGYGIYTTASNLSGHCDARLIEARMLYKTDNFESFRRAGNSFYPASGVEHYCFYRFGLPRV